ncbi:hypothetical protein MKQ70_16425 [Chitinophaga sedimenti]|uniref:hypothetical protein n=1 Tax=Chitinophaga sedimenti TaxID=2033606 RepID=UPI0020062998|nr:hypothetical protein [Chitinophaga sedimenti]MCK7556515.1 hypothetical protein [Chitinophaga sedimenti]
MWNNMGHYTTLRPADGILHKFTPPVPIYCYAGKYGMGQERKTGSGSDNIIRKVIVNMENGEVVYDQTLSLKGALGYWCAAWGNYFYTLNAQTSLLCKEEWTGSELAIRDSVKLDIKGVLWNDSWGNRNAYNYQLLVSEPAGKVMMLPNVWSEFINPPEALLSWTLRDGQLSLVNPNFIQPSAAYMAKLNRPRLNSVPFNVLIKNYHGLYVVLGQNQTTKKWSVIKYVKDRKGNYERITKEEDAWEFVPAGIEVVSSTACARCKNTGIMATVNRVTSEHTDKMIYNQVTTTTTRDVVGQSTCSDCKGLGFSGIQ